jgi:DNA-binding transcriptional ArsR family regulator
VTDPQPIFTALSDATRRAVFERLTAGGPASATKLAAEMPVSRQAVAKHLSALAEAGLVEREQVGREVRYSAVLEPLTQLHHWAEEVESRWDDRLDRLRRSLG